MTTANACLHCDRPVTARGLCARHYQQQRRTGSPVAAERIEADGAVLVRLDKQLDAAVRACAEHQGVTLSNWLREAARERAIRQAAADRKLLRVVMGR